MVGLMTSRGIRILLVEGSGRCLHDGWLLRPLKRPRKFATRDRRGEMAEPQFGFTCGEFSVVLSGNDVILPAGNAQHEAGGTGGIENCSCELPYDGQPSDL